MPFFRKFRRNRPKNIPVPTIRLTGTIVTIVEKILIPIEKCLKSLPGQRRNSVLFREILVAIRRVSSGSSSGAWLNLGGGADWPSRQKAKSPPHKSPPVKSFPRQEFPRQEFPRQEFPGHATSEGQTGCRNPHPFGKTSIRSRPFSPLSGGDSRKEMGRTREVRRGSLGTDSEIQAGNLAPRLPARSDASLQVCDGEDSMATRRNRECGSGRQGGLPFNAARRSMRPESLPSTTGLGLGGIFGLMRALDSAFPLRSTGTREKRVWTTTGTLNRGAALRFSGRSRRQIERRRPRRKEWSVGVDPIAFVCSHACDVCGSRRRAPSQMPLNITGKAPGAPKFPAPSSVSSLIGLQINETIEEGRFFILLPLRVRKYSTTRKRVLQEQ